jgi:hypothetical protein
MNYNFTQMADWELDKANFLIQMARQLGMSLQSYGEVSVNPNSGYTYLWSEDYPFTLFMPISCELKRDDVYVIWTSQDGEEIEESLFHFEDLEAIDDWVCKLNKEEIH